MHGTVEQALFQKLRAGNQEYSMHDEEERVFPEARQRLGEARLRELAAEMGQRKAALRKEMSDIAP